MDESPNPKFMQRAVALSRRGYPAPNPHVGCVIVKAGEIVAEGFHAFAGAPHAEVVALNQGDARGADVYVTLEPCAHQGRTPPCSEALIRAGVARVFYASADPNPRAAGGAAELRAHGILAEVGLGEQAARIANQFFLHAHEKGRPFVTLKAAIGLDGRLALPTGESKWITFAAARRRGHLLRAQHGCVLVGSGTFRADQPSLTARIPGVVNQPRRVVWGNANVPDGFLSVRGTAIEVLQQIREDGQIGVLVEGGAKVLTSFFQAGLYDRVELFVSGVVLGQGSSWIEGLLGETMADLPRLDVEAVRKVGPDVQISLRPRTSA